MNEVKDSIPMAGKELNCKVKKNEWDVYGIYFIIG